jgi:WD40 repeat protein/tRNA A-37 threonylcarbamoyl transferase component Bud32
LTADAENHPNALRLREFADGALGDAELERIAQHLDDCEACRAAVDVVLRGDGFLGRLRLAATLGDDVPEGKAARRQAARALSREVRRCSSIAPDAADQGPSPPSEVGQYVVLGEVGRGGMGVVYQARHRDLRRTVALKMILAGAFASEVQRQRFRREAELAARVQHPHIVQVYEVGLHDGRPFLAMEWVGGGSLADRLEGDTWPPDAAAGLIETLARAIDVAHQSGVVHRDLKPSNILLQTGGDAAAVGPLAGAIPKIADFGLARAMDADGSLTATGLTLGTPEYMAPEQAAGAQVGPAADIYALGAVLYRLLTGQPPFRGDTPMEVLQALLSADPIAPRRFRPAVPRDLETITLKAMAREPQRRYATALALAEDLRRFLADLPIRAQPPSALYHLRKFARRHTGLVAGVAGTVAALVLGLVTTTIFAVGEARQRGQAEQNAQVADDKTREATVQEYRARVAAAVGALALHDVADARRQLKEAPQELRDWEWRHLHSRLDDSTAVIPLPDGTFPFLIGAPDRLRVGAFTPAGLCLTDLAGGEHETLPIGTGRGQSFSATQTRRGLRVAVWISKRAFDLLDEAGQVLCRVEMPDAKELSAVVVSPDGTRLATNGIYGEWRRLAVFDATSGKPVADWNGHRDAIWAITYSPDGTRLASASEDQTARLWDPATGALLATCQGHISKLLSVAFRPDGARLVTTSADGTVRQWDAATGREVEPPYDRHSGEVAAAVYSPDGQWVASAGTDRTIRVWRATGRQDVAILHGHTANVIGVAFAPDGRRLASLSFGGALGWAGDDSARRWEVDPRATLPVLRGHTSYVYPVTFSPDGRWIASGGWDNKVRLWDAATGEPCATLPHPGFVRCLSFGPDGRWLVTGSDGDDRVRIWDVMTARVRKEIRMPGGAFRSLTLSPDGRRVAATAYDGQSEKLHLQVHDLASGERSFSAEGQALAYSPDGRWLAARAADSQTVLLLDARTHETIARFGGHEQEVYSATFSPDSRLLASCSMDRTVRLWELDSRACRVLRGHTDDVFAAAFHPDGTRLATAGRDRAIWLWDLATGQEVARLQGHTSYVWSLAFSPDGATLVSGSGDFTVRLWDTAPLETRYQARREAEALRPDAERLVERLWKQKPDPAEITETLRADPALSGPQRHAAQLALLRRAQPPESGK